MKPLTDQKVLDAAHLAIDATEQETLIRQKMEQYGFGPVRMKEGKTLLTQATTAQQKKDRCYDTQLELAQQINAQLEAVQAQFKEHLRVARTAYRNEPTVQQILRIERIAPAGWSCVRQASYFYHKLQERKLSLATFGVSAKEIQQATTDTTQLLVMRQGRIRQKGLAENCTQKKNEAFRKLKKWVSEFRAVARIAFKDNPQMLEAFGMLVRSGV